MTVQVSFVFSLTLGVMMLAVISLTLNDKDANVLNT